MIALTLFFGLALASTQEPDVVREARALVAEGRTLDALKRLEEASRRLPESAVLRYELGALYGASGRLREALDALEKATELAPEESSYALAYGELLYRLGRAEQAISFLKQAGAPPSPRPEAVLLLAGAYEKLGEAEGVLSTLRRYLELAPDDSNARRLLGEKLVGAKRYDEALEVYRGGTKEPLLLYRAAEILSRNRETYGESESYVRQALEGAPSMLEARLLLARLLDRAGRYEQALEELERVRDEHPESSQVHYNLAQAYQRAGRSVDARNAASRFQELSTKEREAEERKARVAVTYKRAAELLQKGNMLEAEPVFRSVLDVDPHHAQARSMLAKIAFSKGDVVEAKRWITEATEKEPKVGEYHYLCALFETRTGNRAQAEPAVRRSLGLDPGFPDAWSLLGSILLDTGRTEEALDCFQKAAALEPSNPTLQLNLASAYAALGREAEAEAAMERYRRLNQTR